MGLYQSEVYTYWWEILHGSLCLWNLRLGGKAHCHTEIPDLCVMYVSMENICVM